MTTLTLECACGKMKRFEVAGRDLERSILNAGWMALPGEKVVRPAIPHLELLPESSREAASKLTYEVYPGRCPSCAEMEARTAECARAEAETAMGWTL